MKKWAWIKEKDTEDVAAQGLSANWVGLAGWEVAVANSVNLSQSAGYSSPPVRSGRVETIRVEAIVRRSFYFAALGLLAASGCFSASYDAEYAKSIDRYRQESEFQQLNKEPQKVPGDRLLLRSGTSFIKQDDTGNEPWSKPPILKDFPGFSVAYLSPHDIAGVDSPAVLSVYGLTDNDGSLEAIKKMILDPIRQEPQFAGADWATTEVKTGDVTRTWSVLTLVGEQPFFKKVAGIDEVKPADGETQVWVSSDPDTKFSAVLVWRVPKEWTKQGPLATLAPLVARTVEFKAPPVEAPPAANPPEAVPAAP